MGPGTGVSPSSPEAPPLVRAVKLANLEVRHAPPLSPTCLRLPTSASLHAQTKRLVVPVGHAPRTLP